MILLKSPTATGSAEINFIILSLDDYRQYTSNYWRFRLVNRANEEFIAFAPERIIPGANDAVDQRSLKFKIQFLNASGTENTEGGLLSLYKNGELNELPPGFYDLEVYQQPDDTQEETNLLVTLTTFIYIGTESMQELRTAYATIPDDARSQYIYPD